MYLFQLILDNIPRAAVVIYIPLCIYFNVDDYEFEPFLLFHLHSTMYLFQPERVTRVNVQPLFTFHYVSISTYSARAGPQAWSMIYIPLCIYFNTIASALMKSGE